MIFPEKYFNEITDNIYKDDETYLNEYRSIFEDSDDIHELIRSIYTKNSNCVFELIAQKEAFQDDFEQDDYLSWTDYIPYIYSSYELAKNLVDCVLYLDLVNKFEGTCTTDYEEIDMIHQWVNGSPCLEINKQMLMKYFIDCIVECKDLDEVLEEIEDPNIKLYYFCYAEDGPPDSIKDFYTRLAKQIYKNIGAEV